MLLRAALFLSALLPFAAGCGRDASAADGAVGKLAISGSSTIAPLVVEIARRFEELRPGIRVDVQTGGSSKGINDASNGLADIGMASRALKGDEESVVRAYRIAQDGVGLIVHASNPIDSLTDQQVSAIYRGELADWSAVGGPQGEITVVNKASGRATLEVFMDYFGLNEEEIDADVVIGDNQQGIKTVAGNPFAIGYVSIGTAEYETGAGTSIRLLPTAGVEATTTNVGAGHFPIGRPLNLITQGAAEGLALEFIDYCRSSAVHDLIEDLYFVPIRGTE